MKPSRPTRVSRTYTQTLEARPEEVFPLLCPVRELDWTVGWEVEQVLSESGLAEPGCIFTTRDENGESIWTITEHDAARKRVRILKVTAGLAVTQIEIALRAVGDHRSEADVTYTITALSEQGKTYAAERTEQWYRSFMTDWEDELNHYLRTGRKLERSG